MTNYELRLQQLGEEILNERRAEERITLSGVTWKCASGDASGEIDLTYNKITGSLIKTESLRPIVNHALDNVRNMSGYHERLHFYYEEREIGGIIFAWARTDQHDTSLYMREVFGSINN